MMKSPRQLFIFVFACLVASTSACAQSPREQLQQLVEHLQKTPNDNAVRERIIKLASTLKPAPALPDTANTFEGRAQFAFKSAKSENDFLVAAQEYEKAVAAAPWVPGYYADLCTIYEKASKLEDAKRHCGFYLISLTDPVQITDVKRRMAGLDFGIEKTGRDKAALGWLLGEWRLKDELREVAGGAFPPNFKIVRATNDGDQILIRLDGNSFLRATLREQATTWDHWKDIPYQIPNKPISCPGDGAWSPVEVSISADKKSINFSVYRSHSGTCGQQVINNFTLSR